MTLHRPFHKRVDYENIKRIRETFGASAVSYGVLHQGEVVLASGDGFADVEKGLLADADTVYCIASCSKAFVTATLSELACDGTVAWDHPVSEYLPQFQTKADAEISKRATLLDICSHGTGLAPLDRLALGFHEKLLNKGSNQIHMASHLPVAYDFRSRFLYNNFMLGVAGDVISAVTGKDAGHVIRERILQPLGMNRTGTDASEYPDDNVAKGYASLDSGELFPLPEPELGTGTLTGPAGFVRSCVTDMLKWAKAVMVAEERQAACRNDPNESSGPLRGVGITRCARRPIADEVYSLENSYALGWFRHMLPSKLLASIGPNFSLLPEPPVLGRAENPRLTIAHWGEFGGYLTAFYTFPGTCSAVVVMANCSPSRGDPTDLIAQSLCQELFDMQPKVDFAAYAKRAVEASAKVWPDLCEQFLEHRVSSTQLPALSDFTGTYHNAGFRMSIQVYELRDGTEQRGHELHPGKPGHELLGFTINNLPHQTAKLRHYHYDVWTFLPESRDDAIKKGLEGYLVLPMLLLSFKRNVKGEIVAVEWDLQGGVCEGPGVGLGERVGSVVFMKG